MSWRRLILAVIAFCGTCIMFENIFQLKYDSACTNGIACRKVPANNLTFDCRFGGPSDCVGNVLLLHGFPEWSSMYMPLMRVLAQKGYCSVACDQRGYSAGAAPEDEAAYSYNNLRDDVFAVAEAVGFKKFHLVGHDHGAVLGWYAAGSERGRERILSYSGLSVPHGDAFSAGLRGPTADLQQQSASQYFTVFVLNQSASLHGYALFLGMGLISGFLTAHSFQKAIWWYNGAMDLGVLSMPPLMNATELRKNGFSAMAAMRSLYGGTPNDGIPQKVATGKISMPSLYVCGTQDYAILCNRSYALKTKDYCTSDYHYLPVDCGHSVLDCSSSAETEKVVNAIVDRVTSTDAMHQYEVKV
jgi:pimeloyl-ACP methyl ester carboxylesterase